MSLLSRVPFLSSRSDVAVFALKRNGLSALTVLIAMARVGLGFATKYFGQNGNLELDKNKLLAIWTRFEFYMTTITGAFMAAAIGTPFQQHAVVIAGAISVFLDHVSGAMRSIST